MGMLLRRHYIVQNTAAEDFPMNPPTATEEEAPKETVKAKTEKSKAAKKKK